MEGGQGHWHAEHWHNDHWHLEHWIEQAQQAGGQIPRGSRYRIGYRLHYIHVLVGALLVRWWFLVRWFG